MTDENLPLPPGGSVPPPTPGGITPPPGPPTGSAPKKNRNTILIIIGVIVALAIIGGIIGSTTKKSTEKTTETQVEEEKPAVETTPVASEETSTSVTPTTPAPAPTWQTVIDVTANTDKRTEPFYLGSGQKKLLYNVTGDSTLVCGIYIVKEGESLDTQGGFPEVTVSSPGPGETVLVNVPGNYYLDVTAANCTWQVTIQELK